MPLFVYGLNHDTAELDLRGRATFGSDELGPELCRLQSDISNLQESVILSTCNRVELHLNLDANNPAVVRDWLADSRAISVDELDRVAYTSEGVDAVTHIMRVASGLDSQILGESQIQGQFKDAYRQAKDLGTLGSELALVEEFTLRTAKRVRSETPIGQSPVSVAYAAITMAKQIFADFTSTNVLLIGAGSNVRLIAQYLASENVRQLTFTNRTLSNAEKLARDFDGETVALSNYPEILHQFDIVICSTGSTSPIVSKTVLQEACDRRRHKPMFVADLSVPRDVEANAKDIQDVYLYTVDDLSAIVEENVKQRRSVLDRAEALIGEGVDCYTQQRRIHMGASLMSSYRARVDDLRSQAVDKAIARLNAGEVATEVIERLAQDLSNQLAHRPTISLRKASAMKNEELIVLLKEIYELES